MLEYIFWTGIFIVFYAYLGYGIVLYLLIKMRRFLKRSSPAPLSPAELQPWPQVSFVVCAYNEADWITQKIANSVALDYPRTHIRFLFVTDGSNDATPDLVRNYPYPPDVQWELLHEPERKGKIAAFQRAMRHIQTPCVVSTDANTLVNPRAVQNMVRHFLQDARTAAVAGEKRISMGERDNASSAGEGIYWRYESTLKRWDSELWSVVGAAGELFAFRREAYEDVPNDTIVEDFYMTMRMAQKGGRVQYEPNAYAVESSSASVGEELKRKIRIAAGAWQAVFRLAPLLNIFRYGTLSFQYISHRVLRWTLAPALLPVIFVTNILLVWQGKPLYYWMLAAQCLFYGAAFLGYLLERHHLKVKALFVPYYFCVMNYAQYAGFWRFLRGRQSVLWERAQRAA